MSSDKYNGLEIRQEKIDFSIALTVIILAGILISYFTFFYADGDNSLLSSNQDVTELQVDGKRYLPIKVEPDEENQLVIKANEESYTAPESEVVLVIETNTSMDSIQQIILQSKPEKASPVFSQITTKDSSAALIDTTQSVETPITTTSDHSKVKDIVEIAEAPAKSPSNEKQCIILIGAFKEDTNKKRLKITLREEGYRVFETPFLGLTRIGIYHSCDRARLSSRLADFRKRFASDAIILREE